LQELGRAMKQDWDERARRNAKWFINTVRHDQSDAEFDETGRPEVESQILADPVLMQGRDPQALRILEIGCGIGRMTRHLAEAFGEVYATDVSAEMVKRAQGRLRRYPNVRFYETNGCDFAELPSDYFDLAFSAYVFQHVPDREVIRSNIRDVYRLLKPGGIFKFQTSGITAATYEAAPKDTWSGAPFPESEIRRVAREIGAGLISVIGSGTQYCWAMLRKRRPRAATGGSPARYVITQPEIVFYGRSDNPQIKLIPAGGDYAYLTLAVSGLAREEVDANSVSVEIDGREAWPIYVGSVGEDVVAAAGIDDRASLERLTQINLGIPGGMPSGRASVRVRLTSGETSAPITVELLSPQPFTPRVQLVTNASDCGVDVYARGPRSLVRIFASGLDETAGLDNVRVQVGGRMIKPSGVEFLPSNGIYQILAQLPEDIASGATELRLHFGRVQSPAVSIQIQEPGAELK